MPDISDFFISKFRNLSMNIPAPSSYYQPRPYRNAAVRLRNCSLLDFEERKEILKQAGLNVFMFPAHKIPGCDLLSDSGTTTMTMEQWAQMLLGDEAYGSNEGYFELKDQIKDTFGENWISNDENIQNWFIFHQGRACEYALFTVLSRILKMQFETKKISFEPITDNLLTNLSVKLKQRISKNIEKILDTLEISKKNGPAFVIPCNTYFDTTGANVEHRNIIPLNIPCKEHEDDDVSYNFRGNINLEDLKILLEWGKERIPLIYLTITNNAGGGQPVSMKNIKETSKIAKTYKIPLFFDACRFAENAWFIKQYENGYESKNIEDIVHEMFENVDGFHISFKKDGLVNIGGAILIKDESIFMEKYPKFLEKLTDHQILTEGHPTYGGLAGRDLKGLIQGLKIVIRQEYLDHRINQTKRFGWKLIELLKGKKNEAPVLQPIGGHAIYLKMDDFFIGTDTKDTDFKSIALTALLLIGGHRLVELGLYSFGKLKNGKEIPPDPRVNYVRAAIPRLAYEDQDLFSVAEAIKVLYDNREKIPAIKVTYGQDLMLRHFKSRFEFKS